MKNKGRKEVALVASGVMLGVAIAGPAASAALTAQQSSQKIFVDGQQVQIEAYSIGGSNYVRLRDVGKAIGFNVSYDALTNTVLVNTDEAYEDEGVTKAVGTVALPTDGSKYTPQVGDVILCDDGTTYEIKNVDRFENNVFAPNFDPSLPTPTCDWSKYPSIELPAVERRHYVSEHGDDLYVRNLYETRRMLYTIYNALGTESDAWRDGKLLTKFSLTIPAEYEPWTGVFWPWRSSEIEKHVHNIPNVHFHIEAWDYYHNHNFLQTQYYIFID